GRLWKGLIHGRPLEAFQGNYAQREVMMALRQRFRKFTDMRTQVRNIAGFNIGGGTFDVDLALRGPELEKLAEYGEALKLKARELGGVVDVDTTLRLDKPELRVAIDRQPTASASRMDCTDRQRETRLRAGIAPGYGQADRIEALKRAVAGMSMPSAYQTFVTGKAKEMEKTFTEFLWVFLLSVVFMYMILA